MTCAHCDRFLLQERVAANPLAGLVSYKEEGRIRLPSLSSESFSYIPWVLPTYKEFARPDISTQTPTIKWRHLRQELELSASLTEDCVCSAHTILKAGGFLITMQCPHCQGPLLDYTTALETLHPRHCLRCGARPELDA